MGHAVESILGAVSVDVHVSPHATRPGLELFQPHLQPPRSKPLNVELGVNEGFEDEFSRCVKLSSNEGLLFSRFRYDCGLVFCQIFTSASCASFVSLLPVRCRVSRTSRSRVPW